jgi:hypothetical protein
MQTIKTFAFLSSLAFFAAIPGANAGTISNGIWTPSNCGEKPVIPVIKDSDVDVFNTSVENINAWQLKSKTYFECLVKEANADNNAIAQSANRDQSAYRDSVDKVREEIAAASKKLDGK